MKITIAFLILISSLGVNAQIPIPPKELAGPDLVCNQATFTLMQCSQLVNCNNLIPYSHSSATLWEYDSNLFDKVSGGNGYNFITLSVKPGQSQQYGESTVTGGIAHHLANGSQIMIFGRSKTPWVGKPAAIDGTINGPSNATQGQVITYWLNENSTQNDYSVPDWILPYNSGLCSGTCWQLLSGGFGFQYAKVKVGSSSGYMQVRRKNACGAGGVILRYVSVSGGGPGCTICPQPYISPNPANGVIGVNNLVSVSSENQNVSTALDSQTFDYDVEYEIVDFNGRVVKKVKSNRVHEYIDVSDISLSGVYVLKAKYGTKGVVTKRIVLKR